MPKVFIRNYLIFTAVLLLCVTSLGYVLISGDRQIHKSDEWVSHSYNVILEVEQLNALVANMLATQRGYMITQNDKFMEVYEEQKAAASRSLATLSELGADNPSQQSRLQELRTYFTEFSERLDKRVELSRNDSAQKVLENVEDINRLKNNMTRLKQDLLSEEYGLLNQRIREVEGKRDQYFLTLLIGGGVAVVLLMLFNGYLLRIQSKRSAAEFALGEKEEIFRLAVEGTQDGVFDWNIKTDEIYYSDQFKAMLGYAPDEFEGTLKASTDIVHPEEVDEVMEYVQLYLDGQLSEYSNTFRMQHKTGRWLWVTVRAKAVLDKNGQPVRLVGALTDVSAAKEYENKLQEAKLKAEEANRAKSDFLAHMSHEIRTPLTTISGASEILAQNTDAFSKKQRDLVKVLSSSSVTLKDIISDVLDFSKIENGELELEETAFELQDAFEHIVSIMSVKTREKKLDFKFDFKGVKALTFYGDPVRLRQVLINLIGNAVKFTEKGHVHVTARKDQKDGIDVLAIEIKDSGIGIDESNLEVVFERFKQADSSVSRKFGGTGLGLPISRKLVSLMGGDIQVKSELGKGSTFTVLLPFRVAEGSKDERGRDKLRTNKINDRLKSVINDQEKLLLVEDYEGNVVVIGYILDEMGIEFEVARTGLEAINMWKENHYDLILMDIQMPEMDGFTATKQIRKIENEQNLKNTPIIGMTAHALVGDKDKCIESGMDAYLPKPIVEMDLKKTILKFLKLKQKAA